MHNLDEVVLIIIHLARKRDLASRLMLIEFEYGIAHVSCRVPPYAIQICKPNAAWKPIMKILRHRAFAILVHHIVFEVLRDDSIIITKVLLSVHLIVLNEPVHFA
jgi:hypothetical protein